MIAGGGILSILFSHAKQDADARGGLRACASEQTASMSVQSASVAVCATSREEQSNHPAYGFSSGVNCFDTIIKMRKKNFVIGIDEVGRGALAGPVVVAAVSLPRRFRPAKSLGTLKDSKKLSPIQRERWFDYFKSRHSFAYAIARVYPRGIEKMNISNAANRAATKAFERLLRNWEIGKFGVFLDGGLFLEGHRECKPRTVTKGDERIAAVKAASIVAKVSRDRYMEKLARRHSNYGFEIHKGYGTRKHRSALLQYGPGPMHRLTFLKKYPTIQRANGL